MPYIAVFCVEDEYNATRMDSRKGPVIAPCEHDGLLYCRACMHRGAARAHGAITYVCATCVQGVLSHAGAIALSRGHHEVCSQTTKTREARVPVSVVRWAFPRGLIGRFSSARNTVDSRA